MRGWLRRNAVRLVYLLGVVCLAATAFTWPLLNVAALGFAPLGAGLVWMAYDLIDVEDSRDKSATTSRR